MMSELYGRSPVLEVMKQLLRKTHRIKHHQRRHVSDLQVCLAVRMYRVALDLREAGTSQPSYPYTIIADQVGVPEKVAYRAMERAYANDLLEYGTSLRTAWLTDKGVLLLQENNMWKVK